MSVQRFETGISENNLSHWNCLQGIKEFIQNGVYAKSILGDELSMYHDGENIIIHNYPSGFSKSKLLIGESEQAHIAGAPGQFGEGMKVAMGILLNKGVSCEIQTNGFKVVPALEPSSIDPDIRALVFYIEDNGIENGTICKIGYSKEALDEGSSHFLQVSMPEVRVDINSIVPEDSGVIYYNGARVCSVGSYFSYNICADIFNRDRSSVDWEPLRTEVARCLSQMKDPDEIGALMKAIVSDKELLEKNCYMTAYSIEDLDAWAEGLEKAFGSKSVIAHDDRAIDKKAEYQGYKVIYNLPMYWKWTLQNLGYKSSADVVSMSSGVSISPTSPEERQVIGWCKSAVKRYYGDYGKVVVASELTLPSGVKCLGMYDKNKDVIYLDSSIVDNKKECFKTLLHETIHRISGAEDNTVEFTREWEKACWSILVRKKED